MKIDRLMGLKFGGHTETIVILTEMQFAINHLIDAHNAKQPEQPKDMTFEEALVHFKAGKRIGRKIWKQDQYFNKLDDLDEMTCVHVLCDDWRVIE